MSYLYFDESKHLKHGFILGAFVYSHYDLAEQISSIITSAGLIPGIDEYKSSSFMEIKSNQRFLRKSLKSLFTEIQIALVISNEDDRKFKETCLDGLQMVLDNNPEFEKKTEIYFDEGIFRNSSEGFKLLNAKTINPMHSFNFEQDSKKIFGVQLADLVAYTCSIILLEHLGVVDKTVKVTGYEGNYIETEMNIGFELWASIRYNFFANQMPYTEESTEQMLSVSTIGKGLFISELCNENIKNQSLKSFGEMYLGCIH